MEMKESKREEQEREECDSVAGQTRCYIQESASHPWLYAVLVSDIDIDTK